MLGKKVSHGALWSIFLNIAIQLLSFLSILIVTRFVTPHDLGVYAAAAIVIELVTVLTEIGIYPVLIQRKNLTTSHYETAWTIQVMRGIIVFLTVQVFAAFFISVYTDQPEVKVAIQAISLAVVVNGFSSIYLVDYQKYLDFKAFTKFNLICRVLGVIVTITAAYILRSFWALVIGQLAVAVFRVVLSYIAKPGSHRFTLASAPDLLHVSRWILVHEIASFISMKSDAFLITRFAGVRALGIYDLGYQLAMIPTQQVALPIARALFPGLAMSQDNKEEFDRIFTLSLSGILYIAVPAGVGLFILADPLVKTLFTAEWHGAFQIIQILAVFGVFRSVFGPCVSALMGSGHMALTAKLSLLNASLRIPALAFGLLQFGVLGLCVAAAVVSVLQSGIYIVVLTRLGRLSFHLFAKSIWRTLVASFLMGLLLESTLNSVFTSVNEGGLMVLFSGVLLGFFCYVLVIASLWILSGRPQGLEELLYARFVRNRQ